MDRPVTAKEKWYKFTLQVVSPGGHTTKEVGGVYFDINDHSLIDSVIYC